MNRLERIIMKRRRVCDRRQTSDRASEREVKMWRKGKKRRRFQGRAEQGSTGENSLKQISEIKWLRRDYPIRQGKGGHCISVLTAACIADQHNSFHFTLSYKFALSLLPSCPWRYSLIYHLLPPPCCFPPPLHSVPSHHHACPVHHPPSIQYASTT